MGSTQKTFNGIYEEYMQNFLCRLLRHDFVVTYLATILIRMKEHITAFLC